MWLILEQFASTQVPSQSQLQHWYLGHENTVPSSHLHPGQLKPTTAGAAEDVCCDHTAFGVDSQTEGALPRQREETELNVLF